MRKKLTAPQDRDPRWLPKAGDRVRLNSGGGFLVEVDFRHRTKMEVLSDPDSPADRWRHWISLAYWRRIATGALVVFAAPETPKTPKVPHDE